MRSDGCIELVGRISASVIRRHNQDVGGLRPTANLPYELRLLVVRELGLRYILGCAREVHGRFRIGRRDDPAVGSRVL